MDERIIQDLKNHWRNSNSSTIGFASNVPTDQWQSKPYNPRSKTFSWEFACLLRTRMCYLKGLRTGQLNFSHQDDIPDKPLLVEKEKKEIVDQLEQLSREILEDIEKLDQPSQLDLVISLLNHERL